MSNAITRKIFKQNVNFFFSDYLKKCQETATLRKQLAEAHEAYDDKEKELEEAKNKRDGWRFSYEASQEEGYDALLDHVRKLNKLLFLNSQLLNRKQPHEKLELEEARNVARKYYRLYQGAQEEILLFQESESYDAKRARDLIAELKEALEQIENWKDEAHYAGMAHKKVQKKLKSMGLKWHNDKVDRNKKLKEAQERITELSYINDQLRQRLRIT